MVMTHITFGWDGWTENGVYRPYVVPVRTVQQHLVKVDTFDNTVTHTTGC